LQTNYKLNLKQKERIKEVIEVNDIASVDERQDVLNALVAEVDLYKKKQTLNEEIKKLYEEIQRIQREIQELGEGTSRDKLRKKLNLQDKVNDLVAKINIYRNEKEIQELNKKIQDLEKQIQDLEKLIRYNNLPFNTKNFWKEQEKGLVKEIDSRNIELNELITKRDNLINDIQPEDDEFNPAQLEEVESDIKKKESEIRNIEEIQLNHVRKQIKDVYRKPYIKVRKLTEELININDQKKN
jgi:prefoldin subunit 5